MTSIYTPFRIPMTVSSSHTTDGSFNTLSHELLNKHHAIHPLPIKNNEDDSILSEWPTDVDAMLENIRCNSIILSDYHKTKYFFLQSRLKYFRIPVIIISAFASVFNIGLQPWVDQGYISVICCMMSLVTGLIGSIELFLQVQKKMESDLLYSRDFYLLAIDIYKVLSLEPKNRHGDGISYLDEKFNVYRKMVENSNILDKSIMDQLAPIDIKSLKNPVHRTTAMSMFDTMSTKNDGEEVTAKTVHKLHQGLASFFKLNHTLNPHHGVGVGVGVDSHVGKTMGVIKASDEDRFQLYCDLVKRSEEFDPMITDILCHLLVAHQTNEPYDISLEDRMKIYCYFVEQTDKFNDDMFPAKLKSILVEDFFTKKSRVKFAPDRVTTESPDESGGNDEGEKTGGTTRPDRKLFQNFHHWVNPNKTEERVVTNSVVTDYDLEVGEKGEPGTKTVVGATEGEDTTLLLTPLQEVSKTKVVSKYSKFVESAPSLYSKNIPKDDVMFTKEGMGTGMVKEK